LEQRNSEAIATIAPLGFFMISTKLITSALSLVFLYVPSHLLAGDSLSPVAVKKQMEQTIGFYQRSVSINGGYLWRYSGDLKLREGEGRASDHTAWVQPPGTPSVGQAFLDSYRLCKESFLLDAAIKCGEALVHGQLVSGGWDYRIEFLPESRKRYAYRTDTKDASGLRNVTTLDDNTTQSALSFLMRLDHELKFKHQSIHEAATTALKSLLRAQYPNGGWPQRFSTPPVPDDYPVKRAGYPKEWPRKYEGKDYRSYYTFNDNSIADTINVMLDAAIIYDNPEYKSAALKAGDFILLSQMPEPQPAWSQQYNHEGHPAWARKFEPPAVTGGESQGIMRVLLSLYDRTGAERFLEPIPPAISYLRKSILPNGQLARFYELKTNKPLFFTKDYKLTYDDSDMPTHYAFKVGSRLDSIEREFNRLKKDGPSEPRNLFSQPQQRLTKTLTMQTTDIINGLDARGAWLEDATLRYQEQEYSGPIIDMRTFARNVVTLATYLGATR